MPTKGEQTKEVWKSGVLVCYPTRCMHETQRSASLMHSKSKQKNKDSAQSCIAQLVAHIKKRKARL